PGALRPALAERPGEAEQAVEAPLLLLLQVPLGAEAPEVDDARRSPVEQGAEVFDLRGVDDRHLTAALAQPRRQAVSESALVGQHQPAPLDFTTSRRKRLAPQRRPETTGDIAFHPEARARPLRARSRLDPIVLALERIGRQRHPQPALAGM